MTLDDAYRLLDAAGDFRPRAKIAAEWTPEAFAEIASETGLSMPDEAMRFLSNCGRLAPRALNAITVEWPDDASQIHEIRSVGLPPELVLDNDAVFRSGDAMPLRGAPVLFFGEADGGRRYLLIVAEGEQAGAIYLWPGLADPDAEPPEDGDLPFPPAARLAGSIAELLASLSRYEDL